MTQNNSVQSVSANETQVTSKFSKNWLIFSAIGAAILVILLIAIYLFSLRNNQAQNIGVTPTPTNSVTPKPDENLQTTNQNVMQFTSEELGITFMYMKNYDGGKAAIKREGNKVYVYDQAINYKDGQYVEVFHKEDSVSMQEDINTRFLKGYPSANCFTISYGITDDPSWPSGYEALQIDTPVAKSLEDQEDKLKLCPPTYTTGNWVSYFEGSNVRKDEYVFLSIGQYSISGNNAQNSWQDTLRFIAK